MYKYVFSIIGDPFCVRAPPSLSHLSNKMRDAYLKWRIKNDNEMDVDEHAENDDKQEGEFNHIIST